MHACMHTPCMRRLASGCGGTEEEALVRGGGGADEEEKLETIGSGQVLATNTTVARQQQLKQQTNP